MIKVFPKCFLEFHLLCSSVFPTFHYACSMLLGYQHFLQPSWNILNGECSIRVFHYKGTVLLESISMSVLEYSIAVSTECFIKEY